MAGTQQELQAGTCKQIANTPTAVKKPISSFNQCREVGAKTWGEGERAFPYYTRTRFVDGVRKKKHFH